MPRKSQRKNARQQVTDDDDDENYSQSQAGPSQLTQNSQTSPVKGLSPEEQQKYVASIVKYILVADRQKGLIQRAQVAKHLKITGKLLRSLMPAVKETLERVFGYILKETNVKFYVHNTIENQIPHLQFSKVTKSNQVLLLLVLTHIFMTGKKCKEASLWAFLRQLKIISDDDFKNEYFGDVHKLVTDTFVKEQYVTVTKNDVDDEYDLELGDRLDPHMPRYIMELVGKVYGNRNISSWVEQYKRMVEIENENNEEDES